MKQTIEYAPEYSTPERIRTVLIYLAVCGAIVGASKFWLFPAVSEFAATSHCRSMYGIAGTKVFSYGLFFGIPLVMLISALWIPWQGWQSVQSGQFPPPGKKVYRKTLIRRGDRAKRIGTLQMLAILPFVAMTGWGYLEAGKFADMLTTSTQNDPKAMATCAATRDK